MTFILEELAPNTNLTLNNNFACIETSSGFTEEKLAISEEELKYATPLGRKLNELLPMLYEQELISCENGKIIIPFSTFDFLYKNDDENGYGLSDFLPKY